MLETIYISRHGSRQDWLDPNASRSVTGMYHDPSLSQHGKDQALELGVSLSAPPEGSPAPEMIFSSPFYRTLQTATPLAQKLDLQIHMELGIMEWFSKARTGTGLHSRPYAYDVLKQYFPEGILHPTYTSTVYPSRRGESIEEVNDRIRTFVKVFINRIEAEFPNVKTISLIAHAATVIALGRALLIDPDADIRTGTASTSKYIRVGQEWKQEWNAKTDYLTEGEERHWDFSFVVLNEDGSVIEDSGDGLPFTYADELPVGVAEGLEKYLT